MRVNSISFMKDEHTCLLCLGSNSESRYHLKNAEIALNKSLPGIYWGEIIETKAEGENAGLTPYLNRLALLHTSLEINDLKQLFKQVEKENGRMEESKKNGIVPLDIDLLAYDNQILKPKDLEKEYMKQLSARFMPFPFLQLKDK